MKNNIDNLTIEQETVLDCPILFDMIDRPFTESCIGFGFECKEGWHTIISDASRELETWNQIFYPKYRIRIQADQIKEKFGTLRFYYSIITDPNKFFVFIRNIFETISHYFSDYKRFNYNTERVWDIKPYKYDDTKEITKEEYEECNNRKCKCSNEELIEEKGKYYRILHLENYGKWHMVPTQHKIAWKIKNFCNNMFHRINRMTVRSTKERRNIIKFMEERAEEIIRKAEKRCENACEWCGSQIGTDWSPTCETRGWISYICTDCAEKTDYEYYKNGALYKGKKMIKSKKIIDKERKEIEKKYGK